MPGSVVRPRYSPNSGDNMQVTPLLKDLGQSNRLDNITRNLLDATRSSLPAWPPAPPSSGM